MQEEQHCIVYGAQRDTSAALQPRQSWNHGPSVSGQSLYRLYCRLIYSLQQQENLHV